MSDCARATARSRPAKFRPLPPTFCTEKRGETCCDRRRYNRALSLYYCYYVRGRFKLDWDIFATSRNRCFIAVIEGLNLLRARYCRARLLSLLYDVFIGGELNLRPVVNWVVIQWLRVIEFFFWFVVRFFCLLKDFF